MAVKRGKTNAAPFPIKYVRGTLVNPTPEQAEREEASRERHGVEQIYRRMRGEEIPGDYEADRAELKALGLIPEYTANGMNFDPGAVVGKPEVDARARDRVTGRAKYSVDTYLPGMLYAKVLRCPHPHAKVVSIDTSKAKELKGVYAVITHEDVPKSAAGAPLPRPALSPEPAFAGEPVAAVAAESEAIAEAALKLIKVQYEKLPFVLNAVEALKDGAPKVRSSLANNNVRNPQFSYERGNVQRGFAEADTTVEVELQTSYEQHVAMEPHHAVAVWDKDQLTLHTGDQYTHATANAVAQQFGIAQTNVHVFSMDTGGGWGDKFGALPYRIITAVLAKKTGRPVKWELNRKDIFLDAGHNYPLTFKAKVGVKRDGTITALEGTSYVPAGAYGGTANTDDWESAIRTYKIANVKVAGYAAFTNTVVTSPLRSVGEASGTFASEVLFSRVAEAIDMDPLEFRLKNLETKNDQVANLPFSSNGLEEALRKGADLFKWKDRWKGWKKTRDLTQPQKGVGLCAFTCNKGGASPPMAAIVQIVSDGSVIIDTGAADVGGGQRTTWMMIVAEALGVPLNTVRINAMDNWAGPDSGILAGTRGTKSVGSGMLAAALDAKRKLLQGVMARFNGGAPNGFNAGIRSIDELDVANGKTFLKANPSDARYQITVAQAVQSGVVLVDDRLLPLAGTIVGEGRVPPPSGYSQKTFGVGFYEVEVDPLTGYVKVNEAVQVHDIGRVINPLGLENQIHGGIMQGINKALTEEMEYDAPTGIVVNANLDEYKLHMIDSMPAKIIADWVEPYDVIGPFGAKGVGEPALLPASASINLAIQDAIGVKVDYQPMTPVRILNAMAKK